MALLRRHLICVEVGVVVSTSPTMHPWSRPTLALSASLVHFAQIIAPSYRR